PPEMHTEERHARDEAEEGGAARTGCAPGPQKRDKRDEGEPPDVGTGECCRKDESAEDCGERCSEKRWRRWRRLAHSQSRQRSCSPFASWLRGFTRKQDRHRNSFSLRGTILPEVSPGASGSRSSSSRSASSSSRRSAAVRSARSTSSGSSTSSGWSSSSRSTTSSSSSSASS